MDHHWKGHHLFWSSIWKKKQQNTNHYRSSMYRSSIKKNTTRHHCSHSHGFVVFSGAESHCWSHGESGGLPELHLGPWGEGPDARGQRWSKGYVIQQGWEIQWEIPVKWMEVWMARNITDFIWFRWFILPKAMVDDRRGASCPMTRWWYSRIM